MSKRRKVEIRVDRYTKFCLTAIIVLLIVLIVGLWADVTPVSRDARAGEVWLDSSKQRQEVVTAIDKSNERLQQLVELFRSGQAKVQVAGEAKEGEAQDHGGE